MYITICVHVHIHVCISLQVCVFIYLHACLMVPNLTGPKTLNPKRLLDDSICCAVRIREADPQTSAPTPES